MGGARLDPPPLPAMLLRPARVSASEPRFYAGALGLFVLFTAAWLAAWAMIPAAVLGWQALVITSGSMQPTIERGDVVVAAPYRGEEIGGGTVIVFEDPGGLGLVTHRIHVVLDDGRFLTKGDANARTDSTPIEREHIRGVGRILVPLIGLPSQWLRTEPLMFVLFAVSMALAVYMARWATNDAFDPWLDDVERLRHLRPRRGSRRGARPPLRHLAPQRSALTVLLRVGIVVVLILAGAASAPSRAAFTASTTSNGTFTADALFP